MPRNYASTPALAFEEALCTLTEDAKEGQLAFREKRKPVWPGK